MRTISPDFAPVAATGLEMAVNLSNLAVPLQRAYIHEGSQLPGGTAAEFHLDWTHTFGTIRIEVKAGVVYIDGQPVQAAFNALAMPCVAPRQG